MSKKFKFLARFLVLTVFVTFVGCNEELYDVKDQHNGVDKNKISLAQFKNETNIGKVEPILSVSTTKSISSKTKTELSDFVIDTLAIKKYISENNKTTYSFRIYPLSTVAKPNEIYNLVYRLVNGSWEKSIFYLLKKEKVAEDHKLFEKIELIYGSTINRTATSKTFSFEMCTIETTVVNCDGSCADPNRCDGFDCEHQVCTRTTITYFSCASGGSSTGGGTPDPSGNGSNNSGSGVADPYSYSPNIYDNPVFDDALLNYLGKREQIWTNLDSRQWFFAKEGNLIAFNNIMQYYKDNNYSLESYEFLQEIINILCQDMQVDVDNNALSFLLEVKKQNKISNNIDNNFLISVDQYIDLDMTNTINLDPTNPLSMHFTIQCAVLRANHPNWSETQIYWVASKEFVHITLDVLGLFPVFGEVADLTNGVLYTIEGDGLNATLSYASAVPVSGWAAFGVKYAVKIQTVATIATKVKLTWKVLADGTLYFGSDSTCRAQLRKVLGLAVGNLNQAHHIIPLNKQTKSIVQKAAKSGNAFHLNEALNGIPLSTAVHNGSHANYDLVIQTKFDQFNASNATPDECYDFLNDLIQDVRTWIANNPNTPINQIILP